MFAKHNIVAQSGLAAATLAALLIAFSPNVHAQSPLTIQPSTGRVGIGTTSPASPLDVNGQVIISSVDPYLSTNSTSKYIVLSGGNGWTATGATMVLRGATATANAHGLELYAGNGERMRIDAAGNVNINPAGPTSLLTANSHVVISSSDPYLTTNTTDKHLVLSGGNGWTATGATMVLRGAANTYNTHGLELYAGNGERMRIDATGKVGIGTTSPDQTLSVNGSASKAGGGSWATYSDRRLKDVNGPFNAGLTEIMGINPVKYNYKDGNAKSLPVESQHIGLIAQEVQSVIPEAVTEGKTATYRLTVTQ